MNLGRFMGGQRVEDREVESGLETLNLTHFSTPPATSLSPRTSWLSSTESLAPFWAHMLFVGFPTDRVGWQARRTWHSSVLVCHL